MGERHQEQIAPVIDINTRREIAITPERRRELERSIAELALEVRVLTSYKEQLERRLHGE